VILALNYGGRDEIIRAVNRALKEVNENPGTGAPLLAEGTLRKFLDNPDIPDPDLIIRSAGEFRISNFLLWESAYAEYYVSPTLWPDWDEKELNKALDAYNNRERKFGGVNG
jgi:undecaprenyl diphosphate synthase